MNTKSLQETIRKVLKEELNESTYLRRRVDMSSLDEEFYKNLNIVTDRFLMLSSGKQSYSFNEFRTTVISYLIGDYRDNLSDEDYDNFPEDEVFNFFLNHFYDKIKDRYVEVFGGDINESTYLRRRVAMSSLDEEFYENLDIVTDRFLKLPSRKQSYSFKDFKDAILGYIIEDFHYELTNNRFDDYPYGEVYEFLSNHYHDKIKDRYVEVFGGNINESETIRRILKEEYEIPLNVRRRFNILKNILGSSLRSSYPCDYDVLDEFIEDIISEVNQYFRWIDKENEMTSEQAELTIRAYLLDDIKEYYLEEIINC